MRTVVITGIAEGLGRTLAELYRRRGERVYGVDIAAGALDRLRSSLPGVEAWQQTFHKRRMRPPYSVKLHLAVTLLMF
jgi:NAD(P)-dependent dehydrogenase (short-subunit alcohol dehydrogenase family)